MEQPSYYKHESEDQQEYVLETSTLRMTVIKTSSLISLKTTCCKSPAVPLFGAINDLDGYELCGPEEFWMHYHEYAENLYSYQPYERLLLDQLYKSNLSNKLQIVKP